MPDAYSGALALGLIAAFIYSLPRVPGRLPRLFMVAALPLAFWGLEALARTGVSPAEARYMYPNGLYVDILACEVLAIFVLGRTTAIAIAILLGAGALGNAPGLNSVGDALRAQALNSRSSLTAAEILRDHLNPITTIPDPGQPQLFLGRYESAVKAYGSTIAWSAAELRTLPAGDRGAVDAALVRLLPPHAGPPPAKPPANCPHFRGGTADRAARLARGRTYVKAGSAAVEVRLRRFGDGFSEAPQVTVSPGTAATVALPKDRSQQPWTAAVRSSAAFTACPL
jgi:hypothetical protein